MSRASWPDAELDPVRQLRAVAAAFPGTTVVERVLDAPFDAVWARVEDMERTVPTFDPLVRSLRIVARAGDRLVVHARSPLLPVTTRFDVELRPGWCWMQSRLYLVGMAAVGEGSRTRYAHLEGVPFRRVPRGLMRGIMRRVIAHDVDGIERLVTED